MLIKGYDVKAIIFDFDGTLVDSWGIWAKVDIEFFKKRGREIPAGYSEQVGHCGLEAAAEYTIKLLDLKETKEDIMNEWQSSVLHEYKDNVKFIDGAIDFIKKLKVENIPFILATANVEACVRSTIHHYDLDEYFPEILSVSQYESKAKPDIYLHAAKKLGFNPSEIMVFEDMLLPITTAKNASFMTCCVSNDTAFRVEDNRQEAADICIHDYFELLK